jgi:hypothetical protein
MSAAASSGSTLPPGWQGQRTWWAHAAGGAGPWSLRTWGRCWACPGAMLSFSQGAVACAAQPHVWRFRERDTLCGEAGGPPAASRGTLASMGALHPHRAPLCGPVCCCAAAARPGARPDAREPQTRATQHGKQGRGGARTAGRPRRPMPNVHRLPSRAGAALQVPAPPRVSHGVPASRAPPVLLCAGQQKTLQESSLNCEISRFHV